MRSLRRLNGARTGRARGRRACIAVVAAAVLMAGAVGCRGSASAPPDEVNHDKVEVESSTLVVKTGPVGLPRFRKQASYVLVEAKNLAQGDLLVSLAGSLVDAGGRTVGTLAPESLRIPAGGSRLFALTDDHQAARPRASSARIRVTGAQALSYAPLVRVTDGHVYPYQGAADVNGYVINTSRYRVRAVVMFAFYDQDGRPMKREFTVFDLDPGGKRGAHRLGPPGSHSGLMYVGDETSL